MNESECCEYRLQHEAQQRVPGAGAVLDELAWLRADNTRLADELAQAQALIAKLERTTLVGGGGSQVEIVEGRSHGWVSDGI